MTKVLTRGRTLALAAVAGSAVLTGCSQKTVSGKVLGGPVLRALAVPENDERLDRAGLAGVEVTLYRPGGRRGTEYTRVASATTTADGMFRFRAPVAQLQTSRIRLKAEGDAIFGGATETYLPGEGETVLFQVPARSAARSDR